MRTEEDKRVDSAREYLAADDHIRALVARAEAGDARYERALSAVAARDTVIERVEAERDAARAELAAPRGLVREWLMTIDEYRAPHQSLSGGMLTAMGNDVRDAEDALRAAATPPEPGAAPEQGGEA